MHCAPDVLWQAAEHHYVSELWGCQYLCGVISWSEPGFGRTLQEKESQSTGSEFATMSWWRVLPTGAVWVYLQPVRHIRSQETAQYQKFTECSLHSTQGWLFFSISLCHTIFGPLLIGPRILYRSARSSVNTTISSQSPVSLAFNDHNTYTIKSSASNKTTVPPQK